MKTTETKLSTLEHAHSKNACYFGERGEWLIAYTIHRDSGTLDRSNWASFLEALGGESDTVAIERSSHWGVGWVDYLIVDPTDAERASKAAELNDSLENYPVLDEQALSTLEWDEYIENWENFGARDFVHDLKREFALSDAAYNLLDDCDSSTLQGWFESLIPSGEYYLAESDSVYPNIRSAVHHCTRENVAQFLRSLRA